MIRSPFHITAAILLLLAFLTGCATVLPRTYGTTGPGPVLDGPVLAIAGEGDLVAAVSGDGLFIKDGEGPWLPEEVPGINRWNRVTCLAVSGDTIYLGSDGDGLHVLSDNTWEARTRSNGSLPDDGVLSITIDGPEGGLPGSVVWVGTREGIAAVRDDQWTVYRPDGDWLVAMTGKSGSAAGRVYVGPGFKLGSKGGDSDLFKPPVTAISAGPDGVVFGNGNSRIALVKEDSVAVINLREKLAITGLEAEKDIIWAGTDKGLIWGGVKGVAEGKPWPINRSYFGWSGTLFGSRDTRGMEYRWKTVGYNTAMVVGLQRIGTDTWAAYSSKTGSNKASGGIDQSSPKGKSGGMDDLDTGPVTDVRRYVFIDEFIARKQKMQYESYGTGTGIRSEPSALYVSRENGTLWIGTMDGLWELENN